MVLNPEISYTHSLSELSVNRKDPCEVIRELISNSYDAEASRIEIYPLYKEKGFIFFDNGTGLSETEIINGITPYQAFFSIGKSTKNPGDAIGYKCQGSKLCFAAKRFTLITRCRNEESWRLISIDNPTTNLNIHYNIESRSDQQPLETLRKLCSKERQTLNILDYLSKEVFDKAFLTGTMIMIHGYDVTNFTKYYTKQKIKGKEYYYLEEYIRFHTRHGDMRILRPNETGFSNQKALNFKSTFRYNDQCELFLWSDNSLKKIEAGFPYLLKPDDLDKIKSPSNVSRLRSGNFYARLATTFEFEERTYCLSLAIDGNGRALSKYDTLDRQGSNGKRSGLKLTDQRGTFICSEGVKACQYNEIFEHSILRDDYEVLATSNAQAHYAFMINGSFQLVTNRNSLTDEGLTVLKNDLFVEHIRDFLKEAQRDNTVFKELIDVLKRESEAYKLDNYIKQRDDFRKDIRYRTRFMVNNVDSLKGKWLVAPSSGQEHWVGALYTMFSHFLTSEFQYANLWLRPRTFSGVGIDSFAVSIEENSLEENVHKGLEYKWTFSPSEVFNHPLIVTDQIVCWEMPIPINGEQVKDSYDYFGYVLLTEELNGIGYEITKIQSMTGEVNNNKVKVISLKNLLGKTFDCEWTEVDPTPKAERGKRKSGR
jgi:hypothetical protein